MGSVRELLNSFISNSSDVPENPLAPIGSFVYDELKNIPSVVRENLRPNREAWDLPPEESVAGYRNYELPDPSMGEVDPVFHGSGALFNKFRRSKIGSGQGAASFGKGAGYFSDAMEFGADYARDIGKKSWREDMFKRFMKQYPQLGKSEDAPYLFEKYIRDAVREIGGIAEYSRQPIKPGKYHILRPQEDTSMYRKAEPGMPGIRPWWMRDYNDDKVLEEQLKSRLANSESYATQERGNANKWRTRYNETFQEMLRNPTSNQATGPLLEGRLANYEGSLRSADRYGEEVQTIKNQLGVIDDPSSYPIDISPPRGWLYEAKLFPGKKEKLFPWYEEIDERTRGNIADRLIANGLIQNKEQWVRDTPLPSGRFKWQRNLPKNLEHLDKQGTYGGNIYSSILQAIGEQKEGSGFIKASQLDRKLGRKYAQGSSNILEEAGLDGIVYPTDTLSGNMTSPYKNYVVFNPKDIAIKKRTPVRLDPYAYPE